MNGYCSCEESHEHIHRITEEFWEMINPLMLVLADIMKLCDYDNVPSRNLEYEDGWYDLADAIADLLEDEGLREDLENLLV